MKTVRAWLMRVFGVFGSTRAERELAAEIESHLQLHIDDHIRAGLSPQEARRRAVLALGGVERTKEEYRDRRGLPAFESLVRDLRYGTRALIKSPGFALAGVIILGLGIGVNSANFIDWEEQNQVFEHVAIFRTGRQTLTGHGEPDSVLTMRASAAFLPILGISPTLGRGFTKDDDREGAPRTALLSDAFFRTRFGGDPAIIGKTITLDRVPHTVIGVLPPWSSFAARQQVWVPLAWTAKERAVRNNHNLSAIAKLKSGVDVTRAQADMDAISKRLEAAYPDDNKDWGALVRPLHDRMVGDVRTSLLVLLGAVAFVLLIACANLANLMLVRTHARAKEIAVRGALGASRVRVIQQLLAEGLVLGAGGGIAGFLAAYYGVDALRAAFGTALPRAAEITVDTRVLLFTAGIAITTGLVAAFVPAWKLTGRDANAALKTGAGRGNSSSGDGRIRNLLVVSEVALALMLLVGAGLLMRSLSGLRGVDAGFDPRNTLTATIDIPNAKYPTETERNQFFDRVIANVRALPGVVSAAFIDNLPLQGGSTQYVAVDGAPPMKESEMPVVAVRLTSPDYFKTSKIPFIAGRDFTDADNAFGRRAVVIVSEGTAKRFWPNQDAIGKRLTLTMMTKESAEIIGVVREVKTGSLDASDADSETAVYAPRAQFGYGGTAIVIRTAGEPARMTPSLIGAVRAIDAEQPVLDITTMDDVVEESLGQRPFAMMLLAAFAILALVLATVGIYSVLAYTVRQRVREIGIRMALGAPTGGVLRLIVMEGLKPTLVGVVLGLALAAALVRVMTTLLYGVDQHDPGTFSAVAVIMIVVGVVATLVPAFRATRVDPIMTLRSE